jgi:leucine-rich repeat protein SHOC2
VNREEDLEHFIKQRRIDLCLLLDIGRDRIDRISNSSNLTTLTLYGNGLITLPESIGNLPGLLKLDLHDNYLTSLPESIGNLSSLTHLSLAGNNLTTLPESIGNLSNLTYLSLGSNNLTSLPESIGNLSNLTHLSLAGNNLTTLPESMGGFSNLTELYLYDNKFTNLPECIENFYNLTSLDLTDNQLTSLPKWIGNMSNLTELTINNNPLNDLSALQPLTELYADCVEFLSVYLPRKYWTKFLDWKPEWLLEDDNVEIRRMLIEQVGYAKICQDLDAREIDAWREYTLLEIDDMEELYESEDNYTDIVIESMVFLKMTCPSTGHIHVLRVPPDMKSAEAAITWVNHGIHPDEFVVQT